MDFDEIRYETRPPLAFITLAKPSKANALSVRMIGEIAQALATAADDEAVKVMIIRADGRHFCAGHDLYQMVDKGVADYKQVFDGCNRMMDLIHRVPQPVIAQVQGVATAAGCQLVAWCDLAVAEQGARFATPGVRIGLFCTTPMVAIARAIGRKAAMEMLLTGRFFSADEARAVGLINRVVPREDLPSETETLALQIAEASRFVLALGKQAFYSQVGLDDDKAMAYAKNTITMNLCAEDAQNGIKAFLQKGKAEWVNR
jgi:enoyl-CoA hydratase/carnithine racemase